ncbi:MAG: respiratory chain complex I subunit 1 family protein [Alistipes shahii]
MAALNTLLLLLAALAIPGLINRTRALLAGRKGIRFAQHLYDVRLLLRKGAVYSPTTTAVFRAAPSVTLGTALVAALFVPVGDLPSALSFEGDLIAFAYLLALGRAALILAAMDTGSSFEGMGASREALYGALVEPALMLVFGTLALLSGYTSFDAIFSGDAVNGVQLVVGAAAGGLRAREDRLHRGRARPGRRPPHAPRTDDDPRSDVPRLLRRRPGLYQDGRMAQDRRAVGARRRRRRRDLLPPLVGGGPARGARHGAFGGHRRIDPGPQQTRPQHHLHPHRRGAGRPRVLHGLPAAT